MYPQVIKNVPINCTKTNSRMNTDIVKATKMSIIDQVQLAIFTSIYFTKGNWHAFSI